MRSFHWYHFRRDPISICYWNSTLNIELNFARVYGTAAVCFQMTSSSHPIREMRERETYRHRVLHPLHHANIALLAHAHVLWSQADWLTDERSRRRAMLYASKVAVHILRPPACVLDISSSVSRVSAGIEWLTFRHASSSSSSSIHHATTKDYTSSKSFRKWIVCVVVVVVNPIAISYVHSCAFHVSSNALVPRHLLRVFEWYFMIMTIEW